MDLVDADTVLAQGPDSDCEDISGKDDVLNTPIDVTESKDGGVLKEILKAGSGMC